MKTLTNADRTAIESLRTLALAQQRPNRNCSLYEDRRLSMFAHMCSTALHYGEEWAVERVTGTLKSIRAYRIGIAPNMSRAETTLIIGLLLETDTARPDGAIASGSVEV